MAGFDPNFQTLVIFKLQARQETPQAFGIYFDSARVDWSNREGNEDEESDDVEDLKAEEYGDEKFTLQLAALAEKYDPTDQDWVPAKYRRERQVKKGRPASYAKGPGIANKSLRSQQRMAGAWASQSSLKSWFGKDAGTNVQYALDTMQDNDNATAAKRKMNADDIPTLPASSRRTTCIEIFDDDDNPTDAASGRGEWSGKHILEPMITNDVEMQNDTEADDDGDGAVETNDGEVQMNDEDAEYWEAELDDAVQDETAAVKDWATLRSEVKTHMKKHSKIMPLSHLDQYMILGNFATLRIRGVTRIKASQEITRQWHDGEGVS
ncbi:hypothetical protein JB92DRAFT_3119111 [Gautieria morchelliformis]|nr:hypothetical protein JB92DRAFT_3119111 [Gautieria morchelliformis]